MSVLNHQVTFVFVLRMPEKVLTSYLREGLLSEVSDEIHPLCYSPMFSVNRLSTRRMPATVMSGACLNCVVRVFPVRNSFQPPMPGMFDVSRSTNAVSNRYVGDHCMQIRLCRKATHPMTPIFSGPRTPPPGFPKLKGTY